MTFSLLQISLIVSFRIFDSRIFENILIIAYAFAPKEIMAIFVYFNCNTKRLFVYGC